MSKLEKTIIAVIVAGLLMMVAGIAGTVHFIHKAGGTKAVIISAGKEVKEISREIQKD
jgi:hypothetical protein